MRQNCNENGGLQTLTRMVSCTVHEFASFLSAMMMACFDSSATYMLQKSLSECIIRCVWSVVPGVVPPSVLVT